MWKFWQTHGDHDAIYLFILLLFPSTSWLSYILATDVITECFLTTHAMSSQPRKKTKRSKKNVTYADDSAAQMYASYERVAVVTRSGAVKNRRVEQNLAEPAIVEPPLVTSTADTDDPLPVGSGNEYVPDNFLGEAEMRRDGPPRKASSGI